MSAICSPESATASLTAVKAWAASGMSAERETLEKPTPLTAILHRFSHIESLLSLSRQTSDQHLAPFETAADAALHRMRSFRIASKDVHSC